MDEVARIHETVGATVGEYLIIWFIGSTSTGLLYYTWVVAGAVIVLVFVLTYLRFLFHLPKKTLLLFLGSGALFVTGALGVELLQAEHHFSLYEKSGLTEWEDMPVEAQMRMAVQVAFEELIEMLAIVVFIYALLSYIGSYVKKVNIEIGPKGE